MDLPDTLQKAAGLLLEPFEFQFMRRAVLAVTLASLSCATMGVYVVLRRMAFIGDALAHTMMPGIVIAFLYKANLFLGALLAGLVTAFGIGWLTRREELREDTAIGVVFTGMFALGVLVMSRARSFRDFSHMLFGNVLGVTQHDLLIMAGVALLVLGMLALFHKELELTSYDGPFAAAIGLRPQKMRYLLLMLIALAVVAGVQAAGVILTSALLITPAAAASLLARRLVPMMLLSTGIALFSGVLGLYASYYYEVASGAAIVLACTGCFATAWIIRAIFQRRVPQEEEGAG